MKPYLILIGTVIAAAALTIAVAVSVAGSISPVQGTAVAAGLVAIAVAAKLLVWRR